MKPDTEIPALDLIEEGLHLLRNAPAALALYYTGAVPFVLGFLFFWADMSRNAYAASRCAFASLLLALGFIWMKCWQAAFARVLWTRAAGAGGETWRVRQLLGLAVTQLIVQPWVLVLCTPLLVLSLPIPFFFFFAQNVTVLGLDERHGARGLLRRAWAQAILWPGQGVQFCLCITVFGLLVFLNVASAMGALPYLLKILFGVESRFTQSPWAIFNSTFFAAAFALTYLCLDPLIKAASVLRCFYGESLKTGEAIWAGLRQFQRVGGPVLLLLLMCGTGVPARDLHGTGVPARDTVNASQEFQKPEITDADPRAAQLDGAIAETLRHPRYAWRMPRKLAEPEKDENRSMVGLFFDSVFEMFGRWFRGFFRWFGNLLDKLFDMFRFGPGPAPSVPSGGGGEAVLGLTRLLLYTCCVLVVCAVAVLIWRLIENRWRLREKTPAVAAVQGAMPDLASEQTAADELPTDGWLVLARQMIERGELRLAMRAFYLASLAHLAAAGLVRVRRSKSNLDYLRELARRAHAWPGLLEAFGANVAAFDRSWYGLHEVDDAGLRNFQANMERIRSLVS